MDIEEAKKGLKRFCEYENSVVLTDTALYEYQEMIETVLQTLDDSISKDKIKEILENEIGMYKADILACNDDEIKFKKEFTYKVQALKELYNKILEEINVKNKR